MSRKPTDIVQGHLIEEETFGTLVLLEDRTGKFVGLVPVSEMDPTALPDPLQDTLSELVVEMVASGELSR